MTKPNITWAYRDKPEWFSRFINSVEDRRTLKTTWTAVFSMKEVEDRGWDLISTIEFDTNEDYLAFILEWNVYG